MDVASPLTPKAINPRAPDAEMPVSFWPADSGRAAQGRLARIANLREQIRSWMLDHALPYWARNGVDSVNGGFIKQLTLDGRDAGTLFKRTRVTARQTYVFSHVCFLGCNDSREAAQDGIDFLAYHAWRGAESGFARTVLHQSDVLDRTPDLYDHAFALYAFAWRDRTEHGSLSRDWMHRPLDFIETHLRHPSGEDFWHELPSTGCRLQDRHMHLAEACLAAAESTGEARFAETSPRLMTLFQRLFYRTTGALREHYDDAWRHVPGAPGRHVEPGRMMEWAWILNQPRKLINADTGDNIRALVAFAKRHGVDRVSDTTFKAGRDDGLPLDRGSRIWPNTKRIKKAAVALSESASVDPWPVIEQSSRLLSSRYLGWEPSGAWMDAFDASGQQAASAVPASSFYHLVMAFTEVPRISTPKLAPSFEAPDTANRCIT